MAEEKTFMDDIVENINESSEHLSNLEAGSKERLNEANIYEMQAKLLLESDKQGMAAENEATRLELERYKIDEDIKLRREIETLKIAIQEKQAKSEIAGLWARVGLAAVEVGSGIALGILYLKANLKYGGMIGKDGKKWFDDLRRIKL